MNGAINIREIASLLPDYEQIRDSYKSINDIYQRSLMAMGRKTTLQATTASLTDYTISLSPQEISTRRQ